MTSACDVSKVGIILLLWVFIWMLYNQLIRSRYNNPLLDDPLTRFTLELPAALKCYVKDVSSRPENNDCSKENLDGWSLGHLAIYYTIGLFVRDIHFVILAISIICEVWEYAVGWRARWFLDPIVNIIGYHLGVMHGKALNLKFPIGVSSDWRVTISILLVLLVVLHVNNPKMIVGSKVK